MTKPFISIIIPCRNEEVFISKCLDSLLANDYPKDKMEIFVIDALSTDNTLSIVRDYLIKFPFVKIFQNPKKVVPAALNIGIKESRGDFIFIVGAHAIYDQAYLSKCVEHSLKYNADNVGGILNTVPADHNTLAGSLISFVKSNSFGVGNSKFRTGSDKIMEVDTFFGGCYKKEVFPKYGMFNESLTYTSDCEFNKRIKKQGARILLVPDIKATYILTVSSLKKFVKHNLSNGFWSIYPIALTKNLPVSLRHLIPLIFISSLIFLLLLSFKWSFIIYVLLGLLIFYILCSLYFSISSIKKNYYLLPFLPIVFFILHLTYGLGSLWGAIKGILFIMKDLRKNSLLSCC